MIGKSSFLILEDEQGHMLSLRHPDDLHAMNWVEGRKPWGTVTVPRWPEEYDGWGVPEKPYHLNVSIERFETDRGTLVERYIFQNHSDFEIDTLTGEVGIYATFNDNYEVAEISRTQRCNAHIWCGGEVSYVMALRMGGEAPHLGMILTRGALKGYSIERDITLGSNDRGDIILHPDLVKISKGGKAIIEWELFWFEDVKDFSEKLRKYPQYINIFSRHFIYFEGEEIVLESNACPQQVLCDSIGHCGEMQFCFSNDFAFTWANILVLPPFKKLLQNRVRFIMENQQCLDKNSPLYGAYLIYDNEEKRMYYSHIHDHNAARERVGMGVLIARYLQNHVDAELRHSLDLYMDYVYRELFDEMSGVVFNDYGKSSDWHRLYNYAWMIQLFCEVYRLKKNVNDLRNAVKALSHFYASGGDSFYPIGLFVPELCHLMRSTGLVDEYQNVLRNFRRHADNLLRTGTNYPPLEVKFEQSIIAPAAELMMQAYELFGDEQYLESAKEHLHLLKFFNGWQPDYHMNAVAIRHWDGYWFGKKRLLGDTFPHYWSAISGDSFANYARITGNVQYAEYAERILRGPLSLFRPDGSASCAMIYPMKVNGQEAHVYDPWANDQDWAMYYYLKWHNDTAG